MTTIPGIATLSSRELKAVLKQVQAAEKSASDAEKAQLLAAFAEVGEDLFSRIQETVTLTDKDDSTWAGRSVRGIPFTLPDGREFTMSVTVTDVVRSAEKKADLEAQAQQFLLEQAMAAQQSDEG